MSGLSPSPGRDGGAAGASHVRLCMIIERVHFLLNASASAVFAPESNILSMLERVMVHSRLRKFNVNDERRGDMTTQGITVTTNATR